MLLKSLEFSKILFVFALLGGVSVLFAGQTTVVFNPGSLADGGPFPNNSLTIPDPTQRTGLRINLPLSEDYCDPSASPSVCSNAALLNQLDGFSVNPRLMVCFSGAIDPSTLETGIEIVPVSGGSPVSINQVIVDPDSNCAYAKPNNVLAEQSEYLLIVTDSVHDSSGKKVKTDDAFSDCLKSSDAYCRALAQAVSGMRQQPASSNKIIAASLFTTMSATTWLEKARGFVDAHELPVVLPAGVPFSFSLASLKSINYLPAQSGLGPQPISLSALSGVGQIAFGLYLSPNFLDPTNGTIDPVPTNDPISGPVPLPGVPSGYVPVSFHVLLPATPKPAAGYPVVIYGHGLGDTQFGASTYMASTLAKNGFATIGFEITGHGYGAASTVQLTDHNNNVYTVSTPGRGVLLPGNTEIGATDGCVVPGAIAIRDCGRQTAVDLFALVDTIQRTFGLGLELNPNRIYYVGQSFGSIYGTLFHAVEPGVHAAVLDAGGGTSVDIARLAVTARPLAIQFLAQLGLLNVPPAPPEPPFNDAFNDNYVFRDEPPVTNQVTDAMALQAAFEAADWLGMLGDPLAYAPHLTISPLAGVPPKSTLFPFSQGDFEVPDPTASALIRAAGGQSTAWYLLFEKAAEDYPALLHIQVPGTSLPHAIMSNPTIFQYNPEKWIALAEQQQVASFFSSNGTANPDPNQFLTGFDGQTLFVIPSVLPERLNYFEFGQ